MTEKSSLRLAVFCIVGFIVVLVTLELYYVVVDEENAAHFSDLTYRYDSKHDDPQQREDTGAIVGSEPSIEDTVDKSESVLNENDEPVHFTYGEDQTHHETNDFHEKLPIDKNIPIMIWWTPFPLVSQTRKCNLGECYTTENRALKDDNRTRAFLFYGTDVNASDVPLPRKANHEWALFHEESPKNNPILFHEDTIVLFNHTATFRRHSDFPLVTQCLESINVLEQKPLYTLQEKTRDENRASVVYVQSTCNAPSDRDAYVQELMKYIKVDSLGQCLNNKELPQEFKDSLTFSSKGFYKIVGKYKYTLAFENAICDDYITEKLWRPLELGSVPVYRGSPSVLDWMPNNHSVIVVDDFSSPKALAEYIKKLDVDDASYLKYLEFKHEGGVTNTRLLEHMKDRKWNMVEGQNNFVTGFECLICDRVLENINREKKGLQITKHVANQNHFGCPRPVQFNYPPGKGREQFDRDLWQTEYDEYRTTAKALNEAVLSGEKELKHDKSKKIWSEWL